MRLDQAVSRLFGLSRTAAAALVDAGDALVDGAARPNSHKVKAGSWLDVTLPAPVAPPTVVPQAVPGLRVVYADDDIVVVDKPVGVAAHPSPGWTGPTVIGALAAIGHRISTSGAAERQGVVHRLDVGTTGIMVVAKSEQAYTALKRAFKYREVDKGYHAVVQGHLDPLRGHRRRADRPAPHPRLPLGGGVRRQAEHHPLRHPGGVPGGSLVDVRAGDRPDPPDPGALLHPAAPLRG